MRSLLIALPVLAMLASPAYATGGFVCRTASEPAIESAVGFGHTAGSALFAHRLQVDGRDVPVEAPQWWLDGEEVRLLLTDEQANERVAVILAQWNGETQTYDGTVEYRGRTSWIRCREG